MSDNEKKKATHEEWTRALEEMFAKHGLTLEKDYSKAGQISITFRKKFSTPSELSNNKTQEIKKDNKSADEI